METLAWTSSPVYWAVNVKESNEVTTADKMIFFAYVPSVVGVYNLCNEVLAPHTSNVRLCDAVLHHILLQHIIIGVTVQVKSVTSPISCNVARYMLKIYWPANLVFGALAADHHAGGETGSRHCARLGG